MPFITHRIISILLLVIAVVAWSFSHYHQSSNKTMTPSIENKVWTAKHRGYPSQFGYLSPHLGLRLVETNFEIHARKNNATHVMNFKLFDQVGVYGNLTIQFNSNFMINNNAIIFSIDKSTAQIIEHSDGVDIDVFQSFLIDLLHNMFHSPRKIIAFSENELIVEIPYMGIIRVTALDHSLPISINQQ